jgi:hypothetical protein
MKVLLVICEFSELKLKIWHVAELKGADDQ